MTPLSLTLQCQWHREFFMKKKNSWEITYCLFKLENKRCWKIRYNIFDSAVLVTPQSFVLRTNISPRNRDYVAKYFSIWIRDPYWLESWKKVSKILWHCSFRNRNLVQRNRFNIDWSSSTRKSNFMRSLTNWKQGLLNILYCTVHVIAGFFCILMYIFELWISDVF